MKWPDGTPKSMNNAFNWRAMTPTVTPHKSGPIPARAKDLNSNGNVFTTYSKAVAAIGNFPPVAVSRGKRDAATTPTKT